LGFIAVNRHAVIVAFSGSQAIEDWRYNLSFDLVRGYGGRVHEGFATLMGQVEDSILRAVRQLRYNRQRIWVTGHSRGGAVAMLTGVLLHQARLNHVQVCTFGAPRAGDLAFARAYCVPHDRFENVGDLIPYFPMGDYVSVGKRILLTPAGRVYVPDGSVTDRLVVEDEGDAPHCIEEYISRLHLVRGG
jgi:predicted lipase